MAYSTTRLALRAVLAFAFFVARSTLALAALGLPLIAQQKPLPSIDGRPLAEHLTRLEATYANPGQLEEVIAPPSFQSGQCTGCAGTGMLPNGRSLCPRCQGRKRLGPDTATGPTATGMLVAARHLAQATERTRLLRQLEALDPASIGAIAAELCRVLTHPHDQNLQPFYAAAHLAKRELVPASAPFLAAQLLERAGPASAPAVLAALRDATDPVAQCRLLSLLAKAPSAAAADAAQRFLASQYFDLRLLSMQILAAAGGDRPEAVPELMQSLTADSTQRPLAAMLQFGCQTPVVSYATDDARQFWQELTLAVVRDGLPTFRAGSGDANAQAVVREHVLLYIEPRWSLLCEWATATLAKVGSSRAAEWAPGVVAHLRAAEVSLRHVACTSLATTFAAPRQLPVELLPEVEAAMLLALRSGDATVIRGLSPWAGKASAVRQAAEQALVSAPPAAPPATLATVLEVLAESSGDFAAATVQRLLELGAPDAEVTTRCAALRALGAAARARAGQDIAPLLAGLLAGAAEPQSDLVVVQQWAQLGPAAAARLPELIQQVATAAAIELNTSWQLATHREPAARNGWLPKPGEVATHIAATATAMSQAIATLAPQAPQIVPSCVTALASENPMHRCWAARALQALGPAAEAAIPALLAALADPAFFPVWCDAARAEFLNVPEADRAAAMTRLRIVYQYDTDFGFYAVRDAAADALVAIGKAALAACDARPMQPDKEPLTVQVVHEQRQVRVSNDAHLWLQDVVTRLGAAERAPAGSSDDFRELARGVGRAGADGDLAVVTVEATGADGSVAIPGLTHQQLRARVGAGALPKCLDRIVTGMRAGGRRSVEVSAQQLDDEWRAVVDSGKQIDTPHRERLRERERLRVRNGGTATPTNAGATLTVTVTVHSLDFSARDLVAAVGPGRALKGSVVHGPPSIQDQQFTLVISAVDAAKQTIEGRIAWADRGRGARDFRGTFATDQHGVVYVRFAETFGSGRKARTLRSYGLALTEQDGKRVLRGQFTDEAMHRETLWATVLIDP